MKPLPLSGTARAVTDADAAAVGRSVYRLRSLDMSRADVGDRDAALIRDSKDLAVARETDVSAIVLVDDPSVAMGTSEFKVSVQLDGRFRYLADGDIIGLHLRSGRFRVLYRRASKHNSFLVTEQCNHYCLMCSQPPRNINDGWI